MEQKDSVEHPTGKNEQLVASDRTVQEFNKIIQKKTVGQLRNKISLGAMLVTNLERDESEDPRMPEAVVNLNMQIKLLERELNSRAHNGSGVDEEEQETAEQPKTGPFDQVIGMQSIKLSSKTGLG